MHCNRLRNVLLVNSALRWDGCTTLLNIIALRLSILVSILVYHCFQKLWKAADFLWVIKNVIEKVWKSELSCLSSFEECFLKMKYANHVKYTQNSLWCNRVTRKRQDDFTGWIRVSQIFESFLAEVIEGSD